MAKRELSNLDRNWRLLFLLAGLLLALGYKNHVDLPAVLGINIGF